MSALASLSRHRWLDTGAVAAAARPRRCGRVARISSLHAEIEGVPAGIGDLIRIGPDGPDGLLAEVVAVDGLRATALPYGTMQGRQAGEPVEAVGAPLTIPCGPALLGRVLDGLGRPVDGGPSLDHLPRVPLYATPPPALSRPRITTPLQVGVRAVDTLLCCGRGQRVGIFAGSGVGKSSLLSMVIRGTDADVVVLALVGERGREVREFLEQDLGPSGLDRSVVVVATSDEPALVRRNSAFVATRVAEHYRDQGLDVLLLMDSVTRFAMAQREIGLAAGELPATRGYPPSAFALLPQLMERAGTAAVGSISGFYTVLVEGDDLNDPIGDSSRSILDGHLSLTRRLANSGHFPSIDVLQSASRVMGSVTSPDEQDLARSFRDLLATYDEARDLIEVGAYQPGTDAHIDRAIALRPAMTAFLRQPLHDLQDRGTSWRQLAELLGGRSS
jgi:flagellum-specific ATP synthase